MAKEKSVTKVFCSLWVTPKEEVDLSKIKNWKQELALAIISHLPRDLNSWIHTSNAARLIINALPSCAFNKISVQEIGETTSERPCYITSFSSAGWSNDAEIKSGDKKLSLEDDFSMVSKYHEVRVQLRISSEISCNETAVPMIHPMERFPSVMKVFRKKQEKASKPDAPPSYNSSLNLPELI